MVFLNAPRASDLDLSHFDLSSSDAQIVAEYFYEQKKLGRPIILLANDARPIRIARNVGMKAMRPAQWATDRADVEDEIVIQQRKRIRELERILGARPNVKFRNLNQTEEYPLPRDFEGFDWDGYLGSLSAALKVIARPTTVSELIKEHGIESSSDFAIPGLSTRLRHDQIEEYQTDLSAFFQHFDIPALEFRERLTRLSRAYILDFDVENDGQAPDEMLSLELALSSNAVFVHEDDMEELNDWGLKIPDAPRPGLSVSETIWDHLNSKDNDSGRYGFKLLDEQNQRRVYRCDAILHGHSAGISVGILPTSACAGVGILATLRTKHLLEPIVRKVTLTPTFPLFDKKLMNEFLLRHTPFMPADQRELVIRLLHHENVRY